MMHFAENIRRMFGTPNPARELARIGIEKRRADVKAVARQIRQELGLPVDGRLA